MDNYIIFLENLLKEIKEENLKSFEAGESFLVGDCDEK